MKLLLALLLFSVFASAQYPKQPTTCRQGDASGKCSDGNFAQLANNTATTSWAQGATSVWDGCDATDLRCKIDTQGMWACDLSGGVKTNCTLISPRPTNVSNESIKNLAPSGVKVFAHYQPWFYNCSGERCNGHPDLGFSSFDNSQAQKVMDDIKRRGIDGLAIDWHGKPYGTGSVSACTGKFCVDNESTKAIRNNQSLSNRLMVIVYDNGSYGDCDGTSNATNCGGDCNVINDGGCTRSDKIASDLLYAYNTFMAGNDLYYRDESGKEHVWFFGGGPTSANFTAIRSYLNAQTAGAFDPKWVFDFRETENPYPNSLTEGSWAWVGRPGSACYGYTNEFGAGTPKQSVNESTPCTSAEGNNVDSCSNHGNDHNFCQATKANKDAGTIAKFDASGVFAHFDNRMTPWSMANGSSGSPVKIIPNRCGQTWVESFGPVNSSTWTNNNNLPGAISINTWNDYDEGSNIEPGIENCWNVNTPTITGNTLNWTISSFDPDGSGHETAANANTKTIAKFRVYISGAGVTPADPSGEKLAVVQDVGVVPNQTSYSMTLPNLNQGSYTLYVQAIGKSSIKNKLSSGVSYAGGPGGGNQPPMCAFDVTPNSGNPPLNVVGETAGSSDPDGAITGRSINWGDGQTSSISSGTSASHTYSTSGTFTAVATCTDNLGTTDTASDQVSVGVTPDRTVTVSEPKDGATEFSPLHIVATANSPNTITVTQVYVDGQKQYEINAASIDTSIPIDAGMRRVTVQAKDSAGFTFKTTKYIDICSLKAASPSVTVCTPKADRRVLSPVRVLAGGKSSSTVNLMQIYIDGVKYTEVNDDVIDVPVPLSPGVRRLTVQAKDAAGATFNSPEYVTSCALSGTKPSVTVCTPLDQTKDISPVHVVAGTTSTNPIQVTQIYVDGTKAYEVNAPTLETNLPLAEGNGRRVTVQAKDNLGNTFNSVKFIDVCTLSTTAPSVTICSPSNGATVQSPVRILAGTTAGANPISLIQIYMDGVKQLDEHSNRLDVMLDLTPGAHHVTVQAQDNAGTTFNKSVDITVQ